MKRQILIINIFSRPHSDVSFTSYSCGTISRKNWNQKRKTRTTPPSVNHFISSEPHRKNTSKYTNKGNDATDSISLQEFFNKTKQRNVL